jgi:hypothetical protein
VVGIATILAVLALLGAVFNLGPFREPELGNGVLIARGDEICRRAHEAFVDVQRETPETAEEAADLTARLVDIAEDETKEINALNGTAVFEAGIDKYLAAREEGIDAMRAGREAAEADDAQAYAQSQSDVAASQRERHQIARRIGFAVCSRPLGPGGP